tara:strand:- start:3698 stop:4543 length:846 start_codon:yes stop_codon:yes gene_type:complete
MITIAQALKYAHSKEVDDLDARILLKSCTNFNNLDIIVNSDSSLSEDEVVKFNHCIMRRLSGEPIAYITGEKEFFGINFNVNAHTLIPRPDTELLVEHVIDYINRNNIESPKILDLGTGSGAIIISILANIDDATGVAVDLNPKALLKAQENAKLNEVDNRLEFVESSWFSNVKDDDFDIIVANPPYITTKMMAELDNVVKDFEPKLALEGGELGYEPYIEIVQKSPDFMKDNAKIFLEIGYDQRQSVLNLFNSDVWHNKKCFKDYGNNDRLITVSLMKNK